MHVTAISPERDVTRPSLTGRIDPEKGSKTGREPRRNIREPEDNSCPITGKKTSEAPRDWAVYSRMVRLPMTRGRQTRQIFGDWSAFTIISGPIPAGSPMVIARSGLVGCVKAIYGLLVLCQFVRRSFARGWGF